MPKSKSTLQYIIQWKKGKCVISIPLSTQNRSAKIMTTPFVFAQTDHTIPNSSQRLSQCCCLKLAPIRFHCTAYRQIKHMWLLSTRSAVDRTCQRTNTHGATRSVCWNTVFSPPQSNVDKPRRTCMHVLKCVSFGVTDTQSMLNTPEAQPMCMFECQNL